jgi:hypothetical protein
MAKKSTRRLPFRLVKFRETVRPRYSAELARAVERLVLLEREGTDRSFCFALRMVDTLTQHVVARAGESR